MVSPITSSSDQQIRQLEDRKRTEERRAERSETQNANKAKQKQAEADAAANEAKRSRAVA